VQTSASVLPIRPDGSRPAFHVVGANALYNADDAPWDDDRAPLPPPPRRPGVHGRRAGREDPAARPRARRRHLRRPPGARRAGSQIVDWVGAAFEHLDYLLPNDEQVLGLTARDDLDAGCRALLERGVGCVVATAGAAGAVVVDAGAANGAGLRRRRRRHDGLRRRVLAPASCAASRWPRAPRGCRAGGAAAALVAQGLGSDHGDFDLAAADAFARRRRRSTPERRSDLAVARVGDRVRREAEEPGGDDAQEHRAVGRAAQRGQRPSRPTALSGS
jgi:hypothetical protein